MRRVGRILLWILGALLALPVVILAVVFIGLNIGPGRILAEQMIGRLTGGTVIVDRLSGRFPDALRVYHLEVRDAQGAWLIADDVRLDWSPTRLLRRTAQVELLEAERLQVPRLPASSPAEPAPAKPSEPFSLPVRVIAQRVHVARAELGPGVLGAAAALSLDGSADVASLQDGSVDLALQRLDAAGSYKAAVRLEPAHVTATLDAAEPDGGLIATAATLPGLGPITIKAGLDGPRNAAATDLALTAGPLQAGAKGTVDLDGSAADLDVSASAPAMTPRPDLTWQGITLQAHVHGPFAKPDATGQLRVDGLAAAGAAVGRLVADVNGNAGRIGLHATAEGVRLPGPNPAMLAAAPIVLDADAHLDDPARPVAFALAHPLLSIKGDARTGGDISATADVDASDLTPFAAMGGIDLHGSTALHLQAGVAGGVTRVELDGKVAVTGGLAPVPGLIGDATLGVSAQVAGADITLSRLEVAGKALRLSAQGSSKDGAGVLYFHLAPAACFTAAAFYQPEPEVLACIRERIRVHPDRFLAMQAQLAEAGLTLSQTDALSRMPRGFEDLKGTAVGPALRLRSFMVRRELTEKQVASAALITAIADMAAAALPLLRFGWDAVDEVRKAA